MVILNLYIYIFLPPKRTNWSWKSLFLRKGKQNIRCQSCFGYSSWMSSALRNSTDTLKNQWNLSLNSKSKDMRITAHVINCPESMLHFFFPKNHSLTKLRFADLKYFSVPVGSLRNSKGSPTNGLSERKTTTLDIIIDAFQDTSQGSPYYQGSTSGPVTSELSSLNQLVGW